MRYLVLVSLCLVAACDLGGDDAATDLEPVAGESVSHVVRALCHYTGNSCSISGTTAEFPAGNSQRAAGVCAQLCNGFFGSGTVLECLAGPYREGGEAGRLIEQFDARLQQLSQNQHRAACGG